MTEFLEGNNITKEVRVGNCGIGDDVIIGMVRACLADIKANCIEVLDLRGNSITLKSAIVIGEFMGGSKTLREVSEFETKSSKFDNLSLKQARTKI